MGSFPASAVLPIALFICNPHGLPFLDFLLVFCSCFPFLTFPILNFQFHQIPPLLSSTLSSELDHLPSHLPTQAKTWDLVWSSLGCGSHGLGK